MGKIGKELGSAALGGLTGGVTTSKGTAGYINKSDDQKGGVYDPKRRAANLAKLKDCVPWMWRIR